MNRDEYPIPVMIRQRVKYTPVMYVSDKLITLRQTRDAKRLRSAGTVEYLSVEDFERIRSNPAGHNLDPGFA